MDKHIIHLKKRVKYAGDVHARLLYAGWDLDAATLFVDGIPDADAEEVVRCKDCEHAERYERTDGTAGYYCGHPQNTFAYGERWDRVFKPAKEADDFCSYGARKEHENG